MSIYRTSIILTTLAHCAP